MKVPTSPSSSTTHHNDSSFLTNSKRICLLLTVLTLDQASAWSPSGLFRLGQRQRLRPVPTNLCVLTERPLTASSSPPLPEGKQDKTRKEREQELKQLIHSVPVYTDFNDVDLVSTAPDFFPYPDDGEVVSPYDEHERDFTFQMDGDMYDEDDDKPEDIDSRADSDEHHQSHSSPTLTINIDDLETGSATHPIHHEQRHHHHADEGSDRPNVRNLKVPQIHLPPRLVPQVGWQHHHRATTSFVHERLHRRRENQQSDFEKIETNKNGLRWRSPLVSKTPEWQRLELHKKEIEQEHLRDMLKDEERSSAMFAEHDGVYLDYSRQRANLKTLRLLQDLAKKQRLDEKIQDMVTGKKINFTEKRAVLHTALRAERDEEIFVDGENVVEDVHQVLDRIKAFSEGVRNGDIRGYTGKRLRNIISVGIGGSYLGPEFLHEVLKTEPDGVNSALGYNLRFLANVDPVDVERTCADLDPEETLIIIVSKTFTTAETMLNARTMRQWLWDFMGNDKEVVRKHVVACASVSATDKVKEFGIDTENYFFRFWDWVGGRYSVCSAVGAVPISLMYGFDLFEQFLKVRLKTCCS